MSTSRYLYRALSRVIRSFNNDNIPLRGATGQNEWVAPTPNTIEYLQFIFRTSPLLQPSNIDEGMRVLRQLQSRLEVFQGADTHARLALRQWWLHDRGVGANASPTAYLAALFAGVAWLKRCDLAEVQETLKTGNPIPLKGMPACHDQFAKLAEEVTAEADGDTQAGTSAGSRQKQLQRISQVLFERHKFRQKPFEWVYDGLSPVLLHDVLESRSGLSIILATIYVSLAAHVNDHLVMAPAPKAAHPANIAGSLVSRTAISATAPTPLDWMVYSPGTPMLQIDPLNKGSITEVSPSDPVHQVLQVRPAYHMAVYAELARIMMIAHQRRGESDDVAHWMWQVMALDHRAPEWDIFEQR